jgi:hemolysin activation/secretion protein
MRGHATTCATLLAAFVATLLGTANAQNANPPDIGTTLREMQQQRPTPPPAPKSSLNIQQSTPNTQGSAAGPTFPVEKINITGLTAFKPQSLQALVSEYTGHPASLADLRRGAANITRFYRAHGYPLARAYVPSQEVRDGVVEIRVLEGHYGTLLIEDEAGVSKGLVRRLLRNTTKLNLIQSGPLERDLLLLQDLQGVVATATLRPGTDVGTADLIVHLSPGRHFQGSMDVDNFGNTYTGQWRGGLGFTGSNLAGFGDQLALRGVFTDQHGVMYGRASYQIPVDVMRIGASVTRTDYTLGKQFAELDARGSATVGSIYIQYPVVKTLAATLDTQVSYSYGNLKDDVEATFTANPRSSREVALSISGNIRNVSGITSATLSYVRGKLDIRDANALEIDEATARTDGSFDKFIYTALHLQNVGLGLSLYGAVSGQRAGKNLDPSEKFSLGGPDAVRAYPQGEGVGDTGVLGTVELRHSTGPFLFFDEGYINANKDPFLPGSNSATLRGAGVGFNLSLFEGIRLRASWAWRLGDSPAQSASDSPSRGWIRVGLDF